QEAARAAYREGLAVARESDDPDAVAEFLDNLGRTFHAEGDFDGAIRAYHEAEAIWREIGQGPRLAMVLDNLGSVHTLRGGLGWGGRPVEVGDRGRRRSARLAG